MVAENSFVAHCPDHDKLTAYLLGVLSGDEAAKLDEHFSTCESCVQAAQYLQTDDELTKALRSAKPHAGLDEETVESLIDRQLNTKGKSEQHDDTVSMDVKSSESIGDSPRPRSLRHEPPDFLSAAKESDEIGRLGVYRIFEVLGAGGMGIVFRAEDINLKRTVAIKAMLPEIAANETAKQRFMREAQATAAIEHDNIVTIHQVAEEAGTPFLAMQFLRGESLEDRIRRDRKLEDAEVLRIGREIAAGLSAAHAQGLLHRDIKPDNIWLEEGTRRVKIVDFGLARLVEGEDVELTNTGVVVGTPKYMAPEQALGKTVDHRCDLFSLGSVLYRLATGVAPFAGSNVTATLISVAHDDPTPIHELNPKVSSALVDLIDKLLQKDPKQRLQSADEIVTSIGTIEAAAANATDESTVVYRPTPAINSNRRRVLIGAVAAAAFAIVLAAIFTMRTPTGELRIEVNDPKLVVFVDDDRITFTDKKWRGEETAEKHRLAIKLGEHNLRVGSPVVVSVNGSKVEHHLTVRLNGVALSSNEFAIVRGDDEAVLTISYEEIKPQPSVTEASQTDLPDNVERTANDGILRPSDAPIRLLPLVKLSEDIVRGRWSRDGDALVVEPEQGARLMLPFELNGDYELTVSFTRLGAKQAVDVQVPVGSSNAQVAFSSMTGGNFDGVGQEGQGPEFAPGGRTPTAIESGKRYKVKVHVRRDGERGSVVVDLEQEKNYIKWSGSLTDLFVNPFFELPNPKRGSIGAFSTRVQFHEVTLRMLSGEARLVRMEDAAKLASLTGGPTLAEAPFDVAHAKLHQDTWAEDLGIDVDYTNDLGMKFRLIPPGIFQMGSVQGDENEQPVHKVTLSKPFYMGTYEVTQEEYEAIVPDNPSKHDGERLPVEFVTSEEAVAYCEALSKTTGQRYRLPTEAEWEFACRAGTTTPWSFGDDPADLLDYAWTKENGDDKTHPVGQKKPNAFGLYDMHGNVFEYCSDFTAGYAGEDAVDPQGPKFGRYHGFRGGSWFFPLFHSRSANRQDKQWPARGTHVGLRVVLEVDQ